MKTIRGRLAVSYAVAMAATLGAFAAAIYLVESPSTHEQLDDAMQARAELIASIVIQAYLSRESIVEVDSLTGQRQLATDVQSLLEGVPDYVLVLGPEGDPLFVTGIAQEVEPVSGDTAKPVVSDTPEPVAGDTTEAAPSDTVRIVGAGAQMVERFLESVRQQAPEAGVGTVLLGSPFGEVRYFIRRIDTAGSEVAAVVSGISTRGLVLQPRRLVMAMLLVAPLVIAASTAIAYVLAGRTLQPVDNIVDEVEAISDGRSLHRRLATPMTRYELSRLITTVNAMLARLERSFAALHRFTADASHELKTPLTVLRSGIERAITHPKAAPEVLEVLEETLVEQKRMTELVDSLLTLARADEGRAPLHRERIDVREVLNEISETANILGEQAAINVSVNIPDRPQLLYLDRERIRQLLMNLLTNAIKYTPAGGEVTVGSVRQAGKVVIKVTDTGVGIAPGELPHVFDRFWRADPARSRSGQRSGAGLGLAISKWIAEAHGGSIQANSRPGRGTTMTVTLPVET